MDFHGLSRRELQTLCKKNKIPANITNVAMADALKALEIVEGLEEFMNQSESNAPQSPASVAKQLSATAGTATRTTRRKTTKEETQSTQLLTCTRRVTRKALAGEMDQENLNMNVLQSPAAPASRRRAAVSVAQKSEINDEEAENDVKIGADVPKTPATQSTRRRATATTSRSKAPETKKDESVQRVYSTRRSVRLLEKSMADLSLKPEEVLGDPSENEEPKNETAAQKNPAGAKIMEKSDDNSENTEGTEALPGKDLNETLEKEWEMRDKRQEDENKGIHSDFERVDSEKQVNLGDVSVFDAKPETYKEKKNEIGTSLAENEAEEKESKVIPVCEPQINTGEPLQEKSLSPSKNMIQGNDSEVPAYKEVLDLGSSKMPAEPEKAIAEDATSTEDDDKATPAHAEDRTDGCEVGLEMDVPLDEAIKDDDDDDLDLGSSKKPAEPEKSNAEDVTSVEDDDKTTPAQVEDRTGKCEVGLETDVQLDGANKDDDDDPPVSETDNRTESACKSESDGSETESDGSIEFSESETETDPEEDPEEDVSDVDSNQAVFGSDVAVNGAGFNGVSGPKNLVVDQPEEFESEDDESLESDQTESDLEEDPEEDIDSKQKVLDQQEEQKEGIQSSAESNDYDTKEELKDSESEEDKQFKNNKTEEEHVPVSDNKKTPTSKPPFAAESISGQFPRPILSPPGKSSSKKQSAPKLTIVADNNNNNNNNVDKDKENSERKAKQPNKDVAKKDMFDEESLKDVSLRQLTKMVKELNIKKGNRTALKKLPDNNTNDNNNQTVEQN